VEAKNKFAADLMARGHRYRKMLTLAGYKKKEDRNWSIGIVYGLTTSEPEWATEVLCEAEMNKLMDWLAHES
jgi:hypothetical protein